METKDYLNVITEEIHSTVVATIDQDGHPVTRVIDMMLSDNHSIYFLTATGKEFYRQLVEQEYISLSGMTGGENSMQKKAVSIHGHVRSIGKEKLDAIFQKNPYMAEIYPTEASREALEVFCIDQGHGDYFDLSTKPITRGTFELGDVKARKSGFYVLENCNGCGICQKKCPQNCINILNHKAVIIQENCLHCGNCEKECPVSAVKRY